LPNRVCPVCADSTATVFFQRPNVLVHCNLLWPDERAALEAPRGDIDLAFCDSCGMIYNAAFDPNLMSYSGAYENSLHFSNRFHKYASALALRLVKRYRLRDKQVIEVGCGTGEFLDLLCEAGCSRGVGFDPSYKDDGSRNGSKVTIVPDYYSRAYVDWCADFFCCRHVLEHIAEPGGLLEDVREGAARCHAAGIFFEVPNGLYTLRGTGIWDIIYEHCSYFSSCSLGRLFVETGYLPRDIYTTFGGQALCIEASVSEGERVEGYSASSELVELQRLAASFSGLYDAKVGFWEATLDRLHTEGRRIVMWGVGSKGVTFLNTVAGGRNIGGVVDANPRKHGHYVAGTSYPIMPTEWLAEYRPDTVLLMNPLYKGEIHRALSGLGLAAEVLVV
jgi:hypothetical protein